MATGVEKYIEAAKNIWALIGPVAGGAGFWAYLKSRTSKPAEIGASNADIASALAEQTKVILAEHHKDRRELRNQVNRQGRDIRGLTKAVAECRQHHAECEDNLTKVRTQIDQMVQDSRVATTLIINPHEPLKE